MLDKCVSQSHFFTVFGTITLKRSNTQKFLIFLFTATTFLKWTFVERYSWAGSGHCLWNVTSC